MYLFAEFIDVVLVILYIALESSEQRTILVEDLLAHFDGLSERHRSEVRAVGFGSQPAADLTVVRYRR
jgi:hypothetical protein